jgi:serine-type D-Ala-D-Ala carboxypeptidase (penicillin-binding protein 5/6)
MIRTNRKKIVISLIVCYLLTFIFNPNFTMAESESLNLDAEAAILVDASTGKVLYEKNIEDAYPIASMTKMMTEYLVLEAINNGDISWETKTEISDYAYSISANNSFSGVGLRLDHEYTVRELYDAMAIYSDNATTITLAELLAGSEGDFVKMMNEKAEALGLPNYEFVNSTGLSNLDLGQNYPKGTEPDDDNLLSAESVALLAYSLIRDYPEVLETSSITNKNFYDQEIRNWNWMLPHDTDYLKQFYYEGVDGLKTGWTSEAGYCFTGTAIRDDMRLISVVIKTPSEPARFKETKKLLDYGYDNFEKVELYPAKYQIKDQSTIPVIKGKEKSVDVQTKEPISLVIPTDDKKLYKPKYVLNEKLLNKEGELTAPFKKGEKIGQMTLEYTGENDLGFLPGVDTSTSQSDLVTTAEVEKANWFVLMMRGIGGFFGNVWSGITGGIKGLF